MNVENNLICEDCGKCDDTVRDTICPFAEEIHGESIDVVLCDECYHERFLDI